MDQQAEPDGKGGKALSAPSLSLPKGGGAIRGIGEKFAANPVTGTGSMSVPLAVSPGRSGFGPQLSLSYDSGSGNGPFGFGWTLGLPSITRKTDKGLPRYLDGEESDVFILSGAEDLVPVLPDPPAVPGFSIRRYRPRIEGLFARIERWTDTESGDVHWRSISRDNITTLYGKDANSRIFNPEDDRRIFSWLICETRDDKGNAIAYEYAEENDQNVDRTQANERNRVRTANRYLKRIQYGNRVSRLIEPDPTTAGWMFEVVFDYGEHAADPKPGDHGPWTCRNDPFSSYRSGFEVRTCRLCQRVLMFHHFEDEDEIGNDCLVRSTDLAYSEGLYSFLRAVTQTGYRRQGGGYLKRSLPPVEFEYTQPIVQDTVEDIDAASLENLPIGIDGSAYQWTDLHGEGIPGILTEQADAWFYKRNLSPISERPVEFAPLELVATKPNLALAGGQAQFMDLAGDGQPDLVVLDGPMPGFYEHDGNEGWQPFRPFTSRLNRDTRDPNLKFVDLDGDGHADVLISEDDAFVWHPSLAEEGFGPARRRVHQALDEEKGPRLVFADGEQSIHLADLSGDGLTDLVRIRNGEVCYWPNLGYGRFGAKVTMDHAPWFDRPDQFDPKRLRLADIDGSGTTDMLYLHGDGVRLYFNQSGNGWSAPQPLRVFPHVDDLAAIAPTDLFGNGTACLVWSSPLPGNARRQMRYVDLMGGQKPHLLIKTINNLGAETRVEYASSTRFYLQDKRDGKPWITKLPFPVHVVERVTVKDTWRQAEFSTTYSYHHGYFDGTEREFRGFGRVEQVDVEDYGTFAEGNSASPYITDDHRLYQPPVKTITWFHTGAYIDRSRILAHLAGEYFRHEGFAEHPLPEPELSSEDLTAEEWREALRACKGMMLRQEIFELDADVLQANEHRPVKLFSTAYHNCRIDRLQPRQANRHAVFLVTESEAITYHYELDLLRPELLPDPRIAHTLNLNVDTYGNVLQSIAVVYPRIGRHVDATLPAGAEDLIARIHNETHVAYTENRFTLDVDEPGHYRLRLPCEVLTYELTGLNPGRGHYFDLAEIRQFELSTQYPPVVPPGRSPIPVAPLQYHERPAGSGAAKRLVEHSRTLYFDDADGIAQPTSPLPFGQLGPRALKYEDYKLALTDDLLAAVFGDKLDQTIDTALSARSLLNTPDSSGYVAGTSIDPALTGQYWQRSGIAGFAENAAAHFYLPERYTDPFGNTTVLEYDTRDLYVQSTTDAAHNRVEVLRFDFRVLAPREMRDINHNHTEVAFDILGLVTAVAVKGKQVDDHWQGGHLEDFDPERLDPPPPTVVAFCGSEAQDDDQARAWLGSASTRFIYHFGESFDAEGHVQWGTRMAAACAIVREQHAGQLEAGAISPLQIALECSDGSGNVLMKKVQAEPETETRSPRWIVNGLTVLNNKGKPVKQYEPFFSSRFGCELPIEEGVTPLLFYDAAGRLVRTELPDGTFSRVEFSPWHARQFDASDTVLESAWYTERTADGASAEDRRAALLSALHTNTPGLTVLDSLGREVIAIAHNRSPSDDPAFGNTPLIDRPWLDEHHLTHTQLDAEGKPLWVRDARGNLVMQYIHPPKPNDDLSDDLPTDSVPTYDIAGNLLYQHSMDAGDRWMLSDAAGKPMLAWDVNDRLDADGQPHPEPRLAHTEYDRLHRPLRQWLRLGSALAVVVERFEYRDTADADAGIDIDEARANNLLGQAVRHDDPGGRTELLRLNFDGQVQHEQRRLANHTTAPVIDWQGDDPVREALTFTRLTEHDALGRMTRLINWHRSSERVAVYQPQNNARGLLEAEDLSVGAHLIDGAPLGGRTWRAVHSIAYNAKGQRLRLRHGNGTETFYAYDERNFRLTQLRTTRPASDLPFPEFRSSLRDERVVQQLHYTYDAVGNIVEILDEAWAPVFFRNQDVRPQNCYVYDALHRLIEATGRESDQLSTAPGPISEAFGVDAFPTDQTLRNYTQRYHYDKVGNFLRMEHGGGTLGSWTRHYETASDSNRLERTWLGSDGDTTSAVDYTYDTHGSMLNLANVPDAARIRWDWRDMIEGIDLGGGGRAWYAYDIGKQRTRKRIERLGGMVEERLYLDGLELYRRYSPSGGPAEEIETHHLFVDDQRVLLVDDVIDTDNVRLRSGEQLLRYQYGNHLGSVALELDETAQIIGYEEFHPYGTTAYHLASLAVRAMVKRYRYTGMERDEETGLSYHMARYYAVWFGRWTSVDSLGIGGGINTYSYASNSPVVFGDYRGLQPQQPDVIELEEIRIEARPQQPDVIELEEIRIEARPQQPDVIELEEIRIETRPQQPDVIELEEIRIEARPQQPEVIELEEIQIEVRPTAATLTAPRQVSPFTDDPFSDARVQEIIDDAIQRGSIGGGTLVEQLSRAWEVVQDWREQVPAELASQNLNYVAADHYLMLRHNMAFTPLLAEFQAIVDSVLTWGYDFVKELVGTENMYRTGGGTPSQPDVRVRAWAERGLLDGLFVDRFYPQPLP